MREGLELAYELLEYAPEALQALQALGILTLAALTQAQKLAIDKRDGRHCVARQAGIEHECDEPQGIERHHILSQRYASKVGFDADLPENIATLCRVFHREYIHPDVARALDEYGRAKKEGRNAFREMAEERDEKLSKREIYWDDTWDRILMAQVQKNNTRARAKGWKWPLSRRQKKLYGRGEM